MRDVHDSRCLGTRSAVTVDERGAHRSQQPLASDHAAIAGVGRLGPAHPEQRDRRDGAPAAERVLDRRLAEDEVGIAGIERESRRSRPRRRRVLGQPRHKLAHGSVELEPDVRLAPLRRVGTARPAFLDAQRCSAPREGIQAAARDQDLEDTEQKDIPRRRCGHRRFDGSQRGHEGGEIPRGVEGRRGLTKCLRVRIRAEPLDELPVRHAALVETLARPLVVLGRGLDQKGVPLTRANATAEGLLRRRRGVALPEESLDDHRTSACRAGRAIKLAHRDAVGRANECALADAIERRE